MAQNLHAHVSEAAPRAPYRVSPKVWAEPLDEPTSPPRPVVWLVPIVCLGALIWAGLLVWIFG